MATTNEIITKIIEIEKILNEIGKNLNQSSVEKIIDNDLKEKLSTELEKLNSNIRKDLLNQINNLIDSDNNLKKKFKSLKENEKIDIAYDKVFLLNLSLFKLQITTIHSYIKIRTPKKKPPEPTNYDALNEVIEALKNKIETLEGLLQAANKAREEEAEEETEESEQPIKRRVRKSEESEESGKIESSEESGGPVERPTDLNTPSIDFTQKSHDYLVSQLSELTGGGSSDMKQIIKKLYNINLFFNSDIMLKLLCIISYKDKFEKLVNDVNMNLNELIDIFFIDSEPLKNILNFYGLKGSKETIFDKNVKRDTIIYNFYKTDNNINKILVCQIINYLNDSDIRLDNIRKYEEFNKIINIYIDNLLSFKDKLTDFYDEFSRINNVYNEIILKYQKVFTIVKDRLDSNDNLTARYIIDKNTINGKEYLKLKYYNHPKHMDGDANKYKDEHLKYTEGPEIYNMGPYDKYYPYSDGKKNKEIAKDLDKIVIDDLLFKGKDVCIVGYGQSGSGKTSTLIYLKTDKGEEDGVLVEICNLEKFKKRFNKIGIKVKNLYLYHGIPSISSVDSFDKNDAYKVVDIKIKGINSEGKEIELKDEEIFFTHNGTSWIFDPDIKNKLPSTKQRGLGKCIDDAFNQREVEPTPNNQNSSRSHVVVCLTLYEKDNPVDDESKLRKIIICDLAGVENKFDCEKELLKFANQYDNSGKYTYYDKENKIRKQTRKIITDKYFCDQGEGSSIIIRPTYVTRYNEIISDINNKLNLYIDLKNKLEKSSTDTYLSQINNIKESDINSNDDNCNNYPTLDILYNEEKTFVFNNLEHNGDKSEIQKNIDNIIKNLNKTINDFIIFKYFKTNRNNLSSKTDNDIVKEILSNSDIKDKESNDKNKYILDTIKDYLKADKGIDTTIKPNNIEELFKSLKLVSGNVVEKIYKGIDLLLSQSGPYSLIESSNKLLEDLRKACCDYILAVNLKYNCELRVMEGYMINRSLLDMRIEIQNLIKRSLFIKGNDTTDILPIFYEKNIIPYCKNININFDSIGYFNDIIETKDKQTNYTYNSKIINIIKDLGVDIENLNFIIFTVINLNADKNNPPNPPYININKLLYYYYLKDFDSENEKKKKLIKELDSIKNNLINYSFYKDYVSKNIIINSDTSLTMINTIITKIISYIMSNNAATLIGSLESTDVLQNTVFNMYYTGCSLDKDIFDSIYKMNESLFYRLDRSNNNKAKFKLYTGFEKEIDTEYRNIKSISLKTSSSESESESKSEPEPIAPTAKPTPQSRTLPAKPTPTPTRTATTQPSRTATTPQSRTATTTRKEKYIKYKTKYINLKREMQQKGLI